jgi:outer membrane protein OmpA-like peptidoglycan-associated protein
MTRALLLIILLSCSLSLFGQSFGDSRFKQNFNKADAHIYNGAYLQALPIVEELHSIDSSIANINYMLGLCHLNGTKKYDKAIYYLEKASKDVSQDYRETDFREKKAPGITYLYLGRAYHYLNQFERAVSNYYNYRSFIDVADIETYNKVRMVIKHAENAIDLVQTPVKVEMNNLGPTVNSSFPEYSPVISADGQSLIFTSRRPGGSRDVKDKDGQYFEDIYVSLKQSAGTWSRPQLLAGGITSSGHQAAIGLSPDGQTLFVYKDDNGLGDIYQSELKDNVWSVPVKMGSDINTTSWETHATVSADGEMLLFTSNRAGGFGGRDIWYCKRLPDGTWGLAQNVGGVINTQYDEESPFLGFDGKTLFFSSQGHTSMGGFDIFRSELDNGVWHEAKNLGFPINTSEDDVFFVLSADGRTAYLSSRREGGLGETDIYSLQVEVQQADEKAVVQGELKVPSNDFLNQKALVSVADASGRSVGNFRPNRNTGRYILIVNPSESYSVTYTLEGFQPVTRDLVVSKEMAYGKLGRSIELDPVVFGDESTAAAKESIVESDGAQNQPQDSAPNHEAMARLEQARLMKEAELEAVRLDSILAQVFAREQEADRLEDLAEAKREEEAASQKRAEEEAAQRMADEEKTREIRQAREAAAREAAVKQAIIDAEQRAQIEAESKQMPQVSPERIDESITVVEHSSQQESPVVPHVIEAIAEMSEKSKTENEPVQAVSPSEDSLNGGAASGNKGAEQDTVASVQTEEAMKRAALLKRLEELKRKKREMEQGFVQEPIAKSDDLESSDSQAEDEKVLSEAEARTKAEEERLKADAAQAATEQQELIEAQTKAEEERLAVAAFEAKEQQERELSEAKVQAEAEEKVKADEEIAMAEATRASKEQQERESAEANARAEAGDKAKAEEERLAVAAFEAKEQQERESAEANARAEAEKVKAEEEIAKVDAMRAAKEQQEREMAEANARAEAEVKAKAEEERLKAEADFAAKQQQERQLAEAKAQAEAEEKAKAEEERLKVEAEFAAKELQERQLAEAKARAEAEEKVKAEEERLKTEAEFAAKEQQERQLAEAKSQAESEARAKAEEERLRAVVAFEAKERQERELAVAKAREEAEEKAKAEEERVKAEAARAAKELQERELAERRAKELAIAKAKADEQLVVAEKARQEQERKAREAAAREKAVQVQKVQQGQNQKTAVKAPQSEEEIRGMIEMNRNLMAENEDLRQQLRMMNAKLDLILAELKRQNDNVELPVESYSEEAATALNEGKKLILQNILFDYNKARLRGSSEKELDKLATFLLEQKDIKLTVAGHTDAIGDPAYNLRLSRARAEAVVAYLVSKGVSASRLKSVGYGQTRPIARNLSADGQDNPLGRQMNRRIEISVTAGDAELIEVREKVISEELQPDR